MFKCDICRENSKPNEKQNKIKILRSKVYENFRMVFDPKTRKRKKEVFETSGFEIDYEVIQCKYCFKEIGE